MADQHYDFETLLKGVWQKRELGMAVPANVWQRPITAGDMQYLTNHYPFLQLVDIAPQLSDIPEPEFITADSGWVIHDYSIALSASPGESLFGTGQRPLYVGQGGGEEDEGGEGAAEFEPGHGTLIKQAFDTAQQMVAIAIAKGWAGADIVDGTYFMKWAAWVAAKEQDYTLSGFEPSQKDEAKRQRLRRLAEIVSRTPGLGARSK